MLTDNQKQLVYWITKRESIRLKKEAGIPKPWSDNPVMQETYFCNVNREDDKVTRWIRENWRYGITNEDNDGRDYYDFAMIVARIFNLPSTLEVIKQPVEYHIWSGEAKAELEYKKSHGERIWNGAYIVSTNGKKIDKLTYCFELFRKISINPNITGNCKTLKEAHTELMKVEGLASFLAGQVVADLKNSPGHPLETAIDWWHFSAPGPGSLRGLEWFWERKVTSKNYQYEIERAYELLGWELPKSIMDILCMQNLQNSFCEYDKFMRVTNGTGRSKRKYNGGS